MGQSIKNEPQTGSVMPKRARDLVEILRELCIVFRAESGISCRIEFDLVRVRCEEPVGDLVTRRVCALLQGVSKRARARLVTLSLAARQDGSVLVCVAVDEPLGAQAEEMSETARARVASLDQRLLALGVRAEVADGLLSIRLIVPSERVSVD